jgi:hypothetical protein
MAFQLKMQMHTERGGHAAMHSHQHRRFTMIQPN